MGITLTNPPPKVTLDVTPLKPLHPTCCTVRPSRGAINPEILHGRPEIDALRTAVKFGIDAQVNNGRVGCRWLVWHRFSHENRTQRSLLLQVHDSKGPVGATGIFDSHRPLHSQATPGNAGRQDRGQRVDPMGRSWESLKGRRFHGLTYPCIASEITRTVTRSIHKNKLCDSHALLGP